MHVYDFITDEFQYQLKAKARKGNDRFEQVLRAYQILFLEHLRQCKPKAKATMLPKNLQEHPAVTEWLQELHEVIMQEEAQAEKIFGEVINGYFLFLRGKHFLSTLRYQDLLENYGLLLEENLSNLNLFFRGTDQAGTSKSKFYHIPYNNRHKVQNQRFSFSGIPFLYLGVSVADIYFEFDETNLNAHTPFIASFAYSPLTSVHFSRRYAPDQTKTKIFNITNLLFNCVNEIISTLADPPESRPTEHQQNNHKKLPVYFRKLMLSHLCTFPRLVDGSPFCEEYIIPQLFTEALRMHKYDGIIFSSTEFSQQKVDFEVPFPNLRFKDNMVWFTEYSDNDLYDEPLLGNFEITVKDLKGYGKTDCASLCEAISKQASNLTQELMHQSGSAETDRLEKAIADICDRIHLYKGMQINQQLYLDTYAGKLELVYTNTYLDYLTSQLAQLPETGR